MDRQTKRWQERQMAQLVKVKVKIDDLSSIPEFQMLLRQVVL